MMYALWFYWLVAAHALYIAISRDAPPETLVVRILYVVIALLSGWYMVPARLLAKAIA